MPAPATTCPKYHYLRQEQDSHLHPGVCPACGIAYDKWRARQNAQEVVEDVIEEDFSEAEFSEAESTSLLSRFTEVPERVEAIVFWSRVFTWCALLAWAVYFAWHGVDFEIILGSFLHNINLAFHEFGHIFFAPFGQFMMILGGSLFQVLLPFCLVFAFTFQQQDNFGASVMLWWCGQSFVDVAPYIRDGLYRGLPLVGGGGDESHDWGNLLTMMNVVERAPHYGNISFGIGCVIMLLGLSWGAFILYRQYQVME